LIKSIWFWRATFGICLGLTLWGLFTPMPPEPGFQHSDKLMHFLAFGSVSVSGRFALREVSWVLFWPPVLVFSLLAEFLQNWLQPSRFFSGWDIAANVSAVLIAWAAFSMLARINRRSECG